MLLQHAEMLSDCSNPKASHGQEDEAQKQCLPPFHGLLRIEVVPIVSRMQSSLVKGSSKYLVLAVLLVERHDLPQIVLCLIAPAHPH